MMITHRFMNTFNCLPHEFSRNVLTGGKLITAYKTRHFTVSAADGDSKSTTSENNEVLTQNDDGIFIISINRPERRNAVNRATAKKLVRAFSEFENNESFKVAVLTGTNGTFCAGYDLKELATSTEDDIERLKSLPFKPEDGLMGPSRMCFSKPVVAAISGYAVAGGLELALLCDLRVVEADTIMGVFCRRFEHVSGVRSPFNFFAISQSILLEAFFHLRVNGTQFASFVSNGVPLIDGGTVRLPRLIGLSRALDLILTGRSVQAEEAYSMGLANSVVEKGQSLNEAIQLAREIAKFPQECMRQDRVSAYHTLYNSTSLEEALKHEYYNGLKVLEQESVKGATRFSKGAGRHGSFDD